MLLARRIFFKGAASQGAVAPYALTQPSIAAAVQGAIVSYSSGTVGGSPTPTLTGRQWLENSTGAPSTFAPVSGAVNQTYPAPASGEVGLQLKVQETWNSSSGTITLTSNAVTIGAQSSISKMAIGQNLDIFGPSAPAIGPINYASTGFNQYLYAAGTSTPVALDSNNMPTADFSMVLQLPQGSASVETVAVTYPGKANVAFTSGAASGGGTISTPVYTSGTDSSTCTITLPAGATANYSLSFTNTQRTGASSVGTGLSNLDIRRSAYVGNTNVYAPEYAAYLAPWGLYRVMDWLSTNNLTATYDWATRPFRGPLCYNSYENIIALGNQMQKPVWICIPLFATDDFVTGLGHLIATTANYPVYVEYVNERWNVATVIYGAALSSTCALMRGAIAFSGAPSNLRSIVSVTATGGVATMTLNYAIDLSVGSNIQITNHNGAGSLTKNVSITAIDTVNRTVQFAWPYDSVATWPLDTGGNFACTDDRSTILAAITSNYANYNMYGVNAAKGNYRLMQCCGLLRAAVGDAKMMTICRPVFSDQIDANADARTELVKFGSWGPRAGYQDAVSSMVYALCGAPYYGVDGTVSGFNPSGTNCGGSTAHTQADFVAALVAQLQYGQRLHCIEQRTVTCLSLGIKHVTYEGGTDITAVHLSANIPLAQAAKQDPTFCAAITAYYLNFESLGVDSYNFFTNALLPNLTNVTNAFYWGYTDSYTDVSPYWSAMATATTSPRTTLRNPCTAVGTTVIDCLEYASNAPVNGTHDRTTYPGFSTIYIFSGYISFLLSFDADCTKQMVIDVASWYGTQHFDLEVNGVVVASNIAYTSTGASGNTAYQVLPAITGIPFKKGFNSVRIVSSSGSTSTNEAFHTMTIS